MALAGGGLGLTPAAYALEGSDFDPTMPLRIVLEAAYGDPAADRAALRSDYLAERAARAARRAQAAREWAHRQAGLFIAQMAQHELAIGARENYGSNDGTRLRHYANTTGSGTGVPWCANFVAYCVRRAAPHHRLPPNAAYVPSWSATIRAGVRGFKETCRSNLRRGDLVLFGSHIGVFWRWNNHARTRFTSIEGNVSGRVAWRSHGVYEVVLFGRVLLE
jgi:hypothetical protein